MADFITRGLMNELPDTQEPFDEGYEWYCPACRSLVVDESVSYQGRHTCGSPVRLLSPEEILTIEALWVALRLLHAANAEDAWPCPTAEAWNSEELAEIRRAIEGEANVADVLHG